jgi:Ca2+-binding RTX toxin-like protein
MAEFTAWEQLFLELVNRARMNPAGEAARFGIDLNEGLASGTISADSKQVLAANEFLGLAADAHSQHMFAVNQFAHQGIGDGTPHERMLAAGYVFSGNWTSGENIAWDGTTGDYDQTVGVLDQHKNLFLSEGHRTNLLHSAFAEAGIGSIVGNYVHGGTAYNSMMSTQNFAKSGTATFVTGVTYRDTVDDNFYGIGEGRAGRLVQLFQGGVELTQTTSKQAGGYAVKSAVTGAVEVVFSGGSLVGTYGVGFDKPAANVKVDMVDDNWIETNVSAYMTRDTMNLRLLGINGVSATGNELANSLVGNSAANTLRGGGGSDVITGGGGQDTLVGGFGTDTLTGGANSDRYLYTSKAELGDLVTKFAGNDFFAFQSAGFGSLATGALKAKHFWASAKGRAHDANDRFVYSTNSDTLFFDPDGQGGAARIKVATIAHDFSLTAADILIV